jgi:hypothetical protein
MAELLPELGVQVLPCLLDPRGVQLVQHRGTDFEVTELVMRRRQYVQQRDLTAESGTERFRVSHGAAAASGEINWD